MIFEWDDAIGPHSTRRNHPDLVCLTHVGVRPPMAAPRFRPPSHETPDPMRRRAPWPVASAPIEAERGPLLDGRLGLVQVDRHASQPQSTSTAKTSAKINATSEKRRRSRSPFVGQSARTVIEGRQRFTTHHTRDTPLRCRVQQRRRQLRVSYARHSRLRHKWHRRRESLAHSCARLLASLRRSVLRLPWLHSLFSLCSASVQRLSDA